MSLPNAHTFFRTVRDTDDPISQEKPLDISDRFWMNNPRATQGIGWLMANALPSQKAKNHTFGHNEDVPFPNWVEHTGATETSSQLTTGLTIDNILERATLGTVLMNTRTKELIRLNAAPTGADTTGAVTRNHGRGVATNYNRKGDKFVMLLSTFEEGFTTGAAQSGTSVYKSFTTGITDEAIRATNTELSEDYYANSSPFERDLDKTWIRLNEKTEHNIFWGGQVTAAATYPVATPYQNYHTMSGLYDLLSTNVWNVSNTISRFDLIDILLEWRIFYKGEGAILTSSYMKELITEMAYGKMVMDQESKVLGMEIDIVQVGGHRYRLIELDHLSEDENLAGTMFLCPQDKMRYRPLQNKNGVNNDLHYTPIARDEVHSKEGEIWGEFGFEFFHEECWGVVEGITF